MNNEINNTDYLSHGSLFSGIGGFDLAAEWMGWENVFHCEMNPFGQKILKHYWPNAKSYEDITKTDFTIHRGTIDILTGGFPCQPYSMAGKRLGKEDDRHLWPEMLRAIREIQPTWVVGENVFGLVNWSGGLVFNEVQTDLEAEGYEVQPYVLPACAVNAPHRRDRIWFVAYSNGNDRRCLCRQQSKQSLEEHTKHCDTCSKRYATNTEHKGLERQYRERYRCTEHREDKGLFVGSENKFNAANTRSIRLERGVQTRINDKQERGGKQGGEISKYIFENRSGIQFENFPTVSPLCNGNDGVSDRLDTSAISFSKWRTESIKAGGNAIVPQVVYQIFKAISQYNDYRGAHNRLHD